jgi:hypothetical protein
VPAEIHSGVSNPALAACPVSNNGNLGVFTTGLTAIWDLKFFPANCGGWYLKGGFQCHDLINNNLVLSENESVGCTFNALSRARPAGASGLASSASACTSDPHVTLSKTAMRGPNGPRDCFLTEHFGSTRPVDCLGSRAASQSQHALAGTSDQGRPFRPYQGRAFYAAEGQ